MTPGSRRKAREAQADDVVFKFETTHAHSAEPMRVWSTQKPYFAEPPISCLKGFNSEVLKEIKVCAFLSLWASHGRGTLRPLGRVYR